MIAGAGDAANVRIPQKRYFHVPSQESQQPVQSPATRALFQAPKRPSLEREATGVLEANPLGAGVRPGVLDG